MMNSCILMGGLTHDPELKQTQSGTQYLGFQIAHNEGSGERQQSHFFKCTAWKSTGEFISKYFKKGQLIAIEGNLKENRFADKEGKKQSQVEILVFKAHFCESKKDKQEPQMQIEQYDFADDADLPF